MASVSWFLAQIDVNKTDQEVFASKGIVRKPSSPSKSSNLQGTTTADHWPSRRNQSYFERGGYFRYSSNYWWPRYFSDVRSVLLLQLVWTFLAGTPYANGQFRIKLVLGKEFPTAPPKGFFLTKIFHPNVSQQGEICVNTLKKDWKPDLGIKHILLVSHSILAYNDKIKLTCLFCRLSNACWLFLIQSQLWMKRLESCFSNNMKTTFKGRRWWQRFMPKQHTRYFLDLTSQ